MTAGANPLTSRATNPGTSGPPTPAVQFRAFVDAFERLGYDVSRLLADIGVKRSELDDPDALIPCATTGALFERSQHMRPLKNLWTRLAAETPLGTFRLLDYLILTSDTVGDGFKQNARYFGLVGAPFVLDIRDDEDPIRVIFVNSGHVPAESVEYGVTLDVRGYRAETENEVMFAYVSFVHEPDDVTEIEGLLGCPVRAGAAWAGLALSRDAWRIPLRRRDPMLRSVLESQADAISSHLPALEGVAVDVRRVLTSRLARGEVDIDAVARELGMSARTLQRRLSSTGLTYHALLDFVRRETAEKCIADSSLSIGPNHHRCLLVRRRIAAGCRHIAATSRVARNVPSVTDAFAVGDDRVRQIIDQGLASRRRSSVNVPDRRPAGSQQPIRGELWA
jgi:AraC-like DNA-binding protein